MPKVSAAYREARRHQVMDAAISCFVKEGFHRTSMEDIVAASGMSHGGIYSYFTSKDDIIEAIAAVRHEREAALYSIAMEGRDAVASLHDLMRAYGVWLADPKERVRRLVGVQIWAETQRSPYVRDVVKRGADAARDAITTLLERAAEQHRLADGVDTSAAARALVALFQGFVLQLCWDEDADLDGYLNLAERLLTSLIKDAMQDG